MSANIKSLVETIQTIKEKSEKNLAKKVKYTEKLYLFIQEAESLGLEHNIGEWSLENPEYSSVLIKDKKDFIKVHKIVGPLTHYNIVPVDSTKVSTKVNVFLRPKDESYNFMQFYYQKELTGNDKCKVVVNQSSYTSVVCER